MTRALLCRPAPVVGVCAGGVAWKRIDYAPAAYQARVPGGGVATVWEGRRGYAWSVRVPGRGGAAGLSDLRAVGQVCGWLAGRMRDAAAADPSPGGIA